MKAALSGSTAIWAFALALTASATTAGAQAPAPATVSPSEPQAVDSPDIIVTAQRRDESLSKTPVAVAVVSADTLVKAQVVSENDLRVVTPGLAVRAGLNSNQLNYSLRGQSQDAFADTRPGALPYINEVQIGGSGNSSAFYDLQSVQVLKGPQGTLFGRSATGGAVLFTTAKPTDEFGGYASALIGNYEQRKFEAMLNLPIVEDKLLARIAGFYQERDGFQYNIYSGKRDDAIEKTGVRGSLTANLGAIHNELVVDYYKADGGSMTGITGGLTPFTGAGAPFIPAELLYAGVATPAARATGIALVQAFLAAGGPAVQALVPAFYDAYFADPRRPDGGLTAEFQAGQARGPYVVNQDGANIFKADNVIVTNATTFDIGPNTQIKNIFGYTYLDTQNAFDGDSSPYFVSGVGPVGSGNVYDDQTRQLSNELQLLGTTFDDRLTYVAGLYYSDEKNDRDHPSRAFDILLGGLNIRYAFIGRNETYAGYAQGTYKLNDDGLSFTVGGRYTSEEVSKEVLPTDANRVALGNPAPPGFNYNQSETYDRFSWTVGLQDQITPELLLYAASRRGYKSGGYNGSLPPKVGTGATAGDGYKDERVTDVELGLKFQGEVGDVPARLNLALFHNWVDNSQRAAFTLVGPNPAVLTVNVPHGKVDGLELDGQIFPTSWLSLGATINYTHSRFSGVSPGVPSLPNCDGATVAANGLPLCFDQVPDAPQITGTIYADVRVPLTDRLALLLHGDAYHQSDNDIYPVSSNFAGTTLDAYTVANFRVGVEDEQTGWSLTANVKNAFEEIYYVGGVAQGDIYQINSNIPGEPRTYTLEARVKF